MVSSARHFVCVIHGTLVSALLLTLFAPLMTLFSVQTFGDELPQVSGVERQPLIAATERLIEAMDFAGTPFSAETITALRTALKAETDIAVSRQVQKVLDP